MTARIMTVILTLALLAAVGEAAEYNSGITATVLKKSTLTSNGQKIAYPSTDRAEVTAMFVYKPGDVIIEVMNAMHNGTNRGKEKVRLIAFYSGEEGSPTVVKPPVAAKQRSEPEFR